MRRLMVGVVAVGSLFAMLAGLAGAQPRKPDATLTLSEGSVAAGIGFTWGNGRLSYKGKTYSIKVDGLSVGEVGVTRATAKGSVFHLRKLQDFSGTYISGAAEATVGGGAGATVMKNQNGVVIELKSTTQGANLKLGPEGLRLSLAK